MLHPDTSRGHCPRNWPSNWPLTCHGCHRNWLMIIVILSTCSSCRAAETNCENTLRLTGETNHSGYIQLLQGGTWHDICSQEWDERIGAVLCTHLGFHSFAGFGNESRGIVEVDRKKYVTYARCLGTETCLEDCEGHMWQRAPLTAPTLRGIAPCYLTASTLLLCSDAELAVTVDPMNSTLRPGRSEAFYMEAGADSETVRQHNDCPKSSETQTDSDSHGRIMSPFYPRFYPGQTHCRWKIEVHNSQQVELVVIDFETEKDRDILSIYEGRISPTGFSQLARLHGNLTGNGSKLTFLSSSSIIYMDFHSDEYTNARGFFIQYKAIPPHHDTSKTVTNRHQPGLTARNVILVSLGILVVLLMSFGTLLLWRRKTRNKKIGIIDTSSLARNIPTELEVRIKTEHYKSTGTHPETTKYFRYPATLGNTGDYLQNTSSCSAGIAVITPPGGTTSCETSLDNLDYNRFRKEKTDKERNKTKTDALMLGGSTVNSLSPVEC